MPQSLEEAVPMETSTSCLSNIWSLFPYRQWSGQHTYMSKQHRFKV